MGSARRSVHIELDCGLRDCQPLHSRVIYGAKRKHDAVLRVVAGCRRRPVVAGGSGHRRSPTCSRTCGYHRMQSRSWRYSPSDTSRAGRQDQRQRLHHPAGHASQGRSWRQPTLIRCRRSPRGCSCSSGRGGFPFSKLLHSQAALASRLTRAGRRSALGNSPAGNRGQGATASLASTAIAGNSRICNLQNLNGLPGSNPTLSATPK